ncbi:MAG: hypothetical protein IJ322_04150, partial [Clostridia bacterium]|nr:hypothetical protein [Clostridia bacterium]
VGSIPAGSANDRKGIKDTVTTVAVFFVCDNKHEPIWFAQPSVATATNRSEAFSQGVVKSLFANKVFLQIPIKFYVWYGTSS